MSETLYDPSGRRKAHLANLDINDEMLEDLISCGGTDIVVIADDSGSMNSRVCPGMTRWDELKDTLSLLLDILLAVDHINGFHLYFLNNRKFSNITDKIQYENIFKNKSPNGGTPLKESLVKTFSGEWDAGEAAPTQDVIVLVMTDGCPTDCSFTDLSRLLLERPRNYYMSFLMCTEEDDIVEKYNNTVDPIWGCDVCDDYVSECKEVYKARKIKLTREEWMVKCVLGGKMSKYDDMDEPVNPHKLRCNNLSDFNFPESVRPKKKCVIQ
eukprot:GHVR01042053.1.p1 GENE.GHVR01042053.1~~GHVR01042053.1.p1  ORF type:complete len:269 (+),score=76.13 GHVR01042053.1:20-826(+)